MSATEVLRRLLDERGVEWWPEKYYKDECTVWHSNGMEWRASEQTDGKLLIGCTSLAHLTPEQAIAATLGRSNVGRYVGLRRGEYWERTENSDYYCGGCGWKVTDHDSYCPECGGALHKTTLGATDARPTQTESSGTCHNEAPSYLDFLCSECGFVHYHSDTNDTGDGNEWHFCPNCGAKVVEPTTNDVDEEDA